MVLAVVCGAVSLLQIDHAISWSIGEHGKFLARTLMFTGFFGLVFAALAATAFKWSRSAPRASSDSS